MSSSAQQNHAVLSQDCLSWLKESVFPKWASIGVHETSKLFVESLTLENKPHLSAHRCLVQARQIYSFAEGHRLNVLDPHQAQGILKNATDAFIRFYAQPNGSFVHAVELDGRTANADADLYSQAFAIFGLAHAYEICRVENYKQAALRVVDYLRRERKNPDGGYTEIKGGKTLFQSNPHMHLFEAAIAWASIDADPTWKNLAREVYELSRTKFIQPTGLLAEHFNQNWKPILENEKYIFEPGHHFEWCWLFHQYRRYCDSSADISVATKLFETAERWGLSADRALTYDEVWSDGTVKKKSARFWPQSERVKAAVSVKQGDIADVALRTLMKKYLLMESGFWQDTLFEDGTYLDIPVKASSLYHIINAISEFVKYRPKIGA